jgi:hypothetical protein
MLRMQSFHHLRSPSWHTTFVRLRQHLRQKSRRDKPSRYGSFEQLHLGHTTRRPSGTIGLCTRSTPPHHLGSSIGQAFHAPVLRTPVLPRALGSTHPVLPPRKQYRTSFPRTCVEDSSPPPPSVRLRQHLRRISRRDKPSRYDSFEKLHFGHTTRRPSGTIGLWTRSTPPHHLGSSIGQAFHAPVLRTPVLPRALGSTHPVLPPRKQYRTSFPRTSGGCIG